MENQVTRRAWLVGAAAAVQIDRAATRSDPLAWSLRDAATALAKRQISSEELTKLCLARIAALDSRLNTFITLDADLALAQARTCDRQRTAGRAAGLLAGIPIALKDNIDTADVRTTAAARVFQNRVPAEDAEVTRRLKTARGMRELLRSDANDYQCIEYSVRIEFLREWIIAIA